jgi:putative DNA primase/helicase
MAALLRALGTYGRPISHRVLLAQPGQHTTELTDLRGLRLAVLEETPEEGRLDTHQLKATIGTPQITARRIRKDDITFDTSHSLCLNTNVYRKDECSNTSDNAVAAPRMNAASYAVASSTPVSTSAPTARSVARACRAASCSRWRSP